MGTGGSLVSDKHAPIFLNNPTDKGLVVFIHGFMGSPRQFGELGEAVHKRGFAVASLLLPGHNASIREFASCTHDRWQSHVDSELERFSRVHADIWLAGHSMGGLLAINAAARYGGHVRGIFSIACPFKLATFSANTVKARLKQAFSAEVSAAYRNGSSVPVSPSLIWRVRKPAAEVKKLMRVARENLRYIRAPVFAVYSASDELTSIESLEILSSGLAGASFEHLLLSDSLHAYYPEREREMIAQALLGFVCS